LNNLNQTITIQYKTNEIALFTLQKSFFFLLLLNSCSAPEVENETTSTNNASPILTNKTFDLVLSTSKNNINDVEKYTKYDVYAYSEKPLFAGNVTFLNQSNEIVTEAVYKMMS
jgi:hypothetical protein